MPNVRAVTIAGEEERIVTTKHLVNESDVEALATLLHGICGCGKAQPRRDRPNLGCQVAFRDAERVLASEWFTDREKAAERRGAERVLDQVEAWMSDPELLNDTARYARFFGEEG